MRAIGRALKRLEDPPLLLGKGRFAADLRADGEVHMRVVRSPIAFGRLVGVDIAEAVALPGVVGVWTATDVADIPVIDFRQVNVEGLAAHRQPVLARDYVRYVGEPVALIFAESAYIAEDAADLVFCDIDERAPYLDPTAPLVSVAPDTEPELTNEAAVVVKAYGDLASAFARAHAVVELEVSIGRHSGVPLETRGALAVPDADSGVLTLLGAAKVPHYNRDAIARMLGLDRDRLQLSEGHVGGGFGIRGELYPEDVLVCAAALRLNRPVRWIEDRREHLIAANHSRDQLHRLRAAVDARGLILGLTDEFFTDQGAYVRTHGATVTDLAAAMLPGPYLVPAYEARGHIRLTNKTPAGTYRAPGRYETTFARESLMDAIGRQLDIDVIEVRRVNLVPEARMPFHRGVETLGTEIIYDSGKYHDLLDRTLAHADFAAMQVQAAASRAAGEMVGVGLALFVEKSGLGPHDLVRMRLEPDGTIEMVTGVASVGQGVETALAQICSETLTTPIDAIRVIHGQTSRIEVGMGAFASRVTVMAGSATKAAAEALRDKIILRAAPLLQASPDDLEMTDGAVAVRGGASMSLAAVATAEPALLESEGWFRAAHMNYPYGVHVAQVRVDPATCGVVVERYIVACDVGRIVNPMLVEGQVVGAVAQGIGGALLEEFVYDEAGQPLATSFADYLMPTSAEMPFVETLLREDAPSPQNPLGVKGAGESGITAAGAAIAAAVGAAIGRPGAVTRLPITPSRLHALLTRSA